MKTKLPLLFILFSIKLLAQPTCQWAYIPVPVTQAYHTYLNAVTDHSGNIIEVGKILGVADMDPGSGPGDTSFTKPSYNYYLSKTNINGSLEWVRYFNSSLAPISTFEYMGLKVNSHNDIIVVGNFFGMVDFDLSDTGVDTLRSHLPTYTDYFVATYDSAGNYKWAINIGDAATSTIVVKAVSVLPNDDIVVSANPNGAVDVDPGPNVHNSLGGNANIICYDENGNYLWNNNIATTYSYAVTNKCLESDNYGNTFLCSVGYYELTINKFDNLGMFLWNKKIGNFSTGDRVNPQSVLVDKVTGGFYVAGTFQGTVDFDPGPLIENRTSTSGFYDDGFIAKYDQDMSLLWVNAYAGKVTFGNYSLDFDSNDIVAVGNLQGTVNFGNGISYSVAAGFSPFYIKIDINGVTQSGFLINGSGQFNTVNMATQSTFVVTGLITSNTDMDPTSAVLQLNTSSSNSFTAVYQSPSVTSINESAEADGITFYPNPSDGYFTILLNSVPSEVVITDLLGQQVYRITSSEKKLNMHLEYNGAYLLTIETLGGIYKSKLIVE